MVILCTHAVLKHAQDMNLPQFASRRSLKNIRQCTVPNVHCLFLKECIQRSSFMAPNSKTLIRPFVCCQHTGRKRLLMQLLRMMRLLDGWRCNCATIDLGTQWLFGAMIRSKTMEWDAWILGWDGISRLKMDEPSNNFSHFMNDTGQLDYISFQIRLHSLELLSNSPVSLYISIK